MAPALDPKVMGNLMDIIQNRKIVGILGFVGLLWFLHVGLQLPEDRSQYRLPGGKKQGNVAWNRH